MLTGECKLCLVLKLSNQSKKLKLWEIRWHSSRTINTIHTYADDWVVFATVNMLQQLQKCWKYLKNIKKKKKKYWHKFNVYVCNSYKCHHKHTYTWLCIHFFCCFLFCWNINVSQPIKNNFLNTSSPTQLFLNESSSATLYNKC